MVVYIELCTEHCKYVCTCMRESRVRSTQIWDYLLWLSHRARACVHVSWLFLADDCQWSRTCVVYSLRDILWLSELGAICRCAASHGTSSSRICLSLSSYWYRSSLYTMLSPLVLTWQLSVHSHAHSSMHMLLVQVTCWWNPETYLSVVYDRPYSPRHLNTVLVTEMACARNRNLVFTRKHGCRITGT